MLVPLERIEQAIAIAEREQWVYSVGLWQREVDNAPWGDLTMSMEGQGLYAILNSCYRRCIWQMGEQLSHVWDTQDLNAHPQSYGRIPGSVLAFALRMYRDDVQRETCIGRVDGVEAQ